MPDGVEPTGGDQNSGEPTSGANSSSNDGAEVAKLRKELSAMKRKIGSIVNKTRDETLAAVAERFGVDVDQIDDVADRLANLTDEQRAAKSLERKLAQATKQLKTAADERDALRLQIVERSKRDAVLSEAQKANCLNPDLLYHALSRRVSVADDGSVIVTDAQGSPSGESVADLVGSTLKEMPYLVRPTASAGAGTQATDNGVSAALSGHDITTSSGLAAALRAAASAKE